MSTSGLTISQLARLSKVTVRTLHHYDDIGLFRAGARTHAGYRLYQQEDLQRLQQILFFRELGFPLEEIRRILSDPTFDVCAALVMQRELLVEKISHLQRVLGAVDQALANNQESFMRPSPESEESNEKLSSAELFEVFGRDPSEDDAEVIQRWGDTEAQRGSSKRTALYRRAQWLTIKQESDQIVTDLAEVMARGVAAGEDPSTAIAERHRQHIERWFYPCSPTMHAALGQLYVQDPRFAAYYDSVRTGLSAFARDAWQANARSAG
jgi:MerR family transcriptional regulator, thiopeptide resistance regulator